VSRIALRLTVAALGLSALAPVAGARTAAGPPTQVGQCVTTRIAELGGRLEGASDSGTAVCYANGGTQVSYAVSRIVRAWRVGDRVKMCLTEVPDECPPGDDRGKVYAVTDLRTGTRWEASVSEHGCGGA
jgi:hypothetical protein